MSMSVMELEEGWNIIENFITRLKNMMEGVPGRHASPHEFLDLYALVYRMCTETLGVVQKELYDMYPEALDEYINHKVLPALRAKDGEDMLKEFVKRWDNHKIMVEWLSTIFMYLDQNFRRQHRIPTTLRELGSMFFEDFVYAEMNEDVKDLVIALINREREGGQIDGQLVQKILEIFLEIGMEAYKLDFETFMLEDTLAYYKKKVSSWTSRSSYMAKTHECLEREKDRVNHYLHASSEEELFEKVQHELLSHYIKLHVRCVLG